MIPARQPRCSVVIRAFNEEEHIGRLLTGITQQTLRDDLEIVLVDSGSTDATVAIATRYPVRALHIQPEEFSFGRSLNQGIEAARGEFIVIASAHVYPVYPDWIARLLAPFEDPRVALTYGKQRGGPESRFSERQIFARWFPERSQRQADNPFCNNANAAIRRDLWEQQPYDESLSGLEDLAWAHWALSEGYEVAYAADAEIIHMHDESPRQVFNRYRREAMAFRRIFPGERFHLWDFIRLYTSNVLSDLRHALRQGEMPARLGEILWFRWMQFWGTYRGFQQSGPLTWRLRETFYYPNRLGTRGEPPPRSVEPIRYNDAVEKP